MKPIGFPCRLSNICVGFQIYVIIDQNHMTNNFAIEVLILFFTLEIRKIVQHDFFPYIALNINNSPWMRLNFHLAWGPFKFFYLGLSYNMELEKFLCWFSYACKKSLTQLTIGRIFRSNSGRHMSTVKIFKDLNGLVINPNGGAN